MRTRVTLQLVLMTMLLSAPAARAELWPPLDRYVHDCVVIVKAKTVGEMQEWRKFAIVEVWKGSADALHLDDEGNYLAYHGEHGAKVELGQEVVFFFARTNQPPRPDGKLSRHGAAFPIKDNKLIYAETSDDYRHEYTVEELKRSVLEIVQAEQR